MNLQNPIYTDENKAREHLEALRWPMVLSARIVASWTTL